MHNRDSLQSADHLSNLINMIWYRQCQKRFHWSDSGFHGSLFPDPAPMQLSWVMAITKYTIKWEIFTRSNFLRFLQPTTQTRKWKSEQVNFWVNFWNFTCGFCVLVMLILTMALYHYFKQVDDVLPSPIGHLSSFVSPAMTKAANEAVRESILTLTLMGMVNSSL